jgi:hypothetical protein
LQHKAIKKGEAMGDEEFWVASHERLPYDPYYDSGLDGFGNPEFMFDAIQNDAELEDLNDAIEDAIEEPIHRTEDEPEIKNAENESPNKRYFENRVKRK